MLWVLVQLSLKSVMTGILSELSSLCNYVIKTYWFKLEGSIRLGRLVPPKNTALCRARESLRGGGKKKKKKKKKDGELFVKYILFQHLWDVKHIRNLPEPPAG